MLLTQILRNFLDWLLNADFFLMVILIVWHAKSIPLHANISDRVQAS